MESRLRKLLSPRRKSQQNNGGTDLDLHSVPHTTATPHGRLPVFINHALRKSSMAKRNTVQPSDLRSLSYNATVPGKPPEVGHRPQRGNGPVKLRTSRRLSSGELLITQQEYDRALDDIRHSEYVLGGKERRISQPLSQQNSLSRDLAFMSSAPNSATRAQSPFATPLSALPPSAVSDVLVSRPFASPAPPLRSSIAQQQANSSSEITLLGQEPSSTSDGLRISSPSLTFHPLHMASSTSLLEPHEEQNPTIQALWKAEYSRLVSIYGQAGVDRNILEIHRDENLPSSGNANQQSSPNRDTSHSSPLSVRLTLPLLPEPSKRGLGMKANLSTSHLELSHRDDHSEGSSNQRTSLLSSSGASSSYTTRTSAEDSVTTRDDLRKIVDDMRLTYLHAIETQTPPSQPLPDPPVHKPKPKSKSRSKSKSKSKKQRRSITPSVSAEAGPRSASRQSSNRTKSWQSADTLATTPRTSMSELPAKSRTEQTSSGASHRISSQPVAGIATLPAIRSSPTTANKRVARRGADIGLKRADSTTLGTMSRQLKIVDNRDPTLSQPALASSPSGSEADSRHEAKSTSTSLKSSRPKDSSVQHTPEQCKPKSARRHKRAASNPSWHHEADYLFDDTDLDVALDVDDFQSLCDDVFNAPPIGNEKLGLFQTWGGEKRDASTTLNNDISPDNPSQSTKKVATPLVGLGLTVLPP